MRNVQKPDHVTLASLVGWLRDGRFEIPDFQREFEWKPWDISQLMRSIFLDYYIGSLLLWKGKEENFKALACEPLYGATQERSNRQYIVLDGQQRLTAMYYAFFAPDVPAPGRKNRFIYTIRVDQFIDENFDEAFDYDWRIQGLKLLDDPEQQYAQHIFPLAIVGGDGWALPNWAQGYEAYWRDRQREAEQDGDTTAAEEAVRFVDGAVEFGKHLRMITEQFQVAYIELDSDIGLDKVCDIFTQINSRGVRLDVFDLMNALLRPRDLQLKQMWREAKTRLDFVESERLNVYVLQVMSILVQNYCSPQYLYYLLPGQARKFRNSDGSFRSKVLVPSTEDFTQRWNAGVDALEGAIDLLRHPQEFGVVSSGYLPYVSILPAFAALQVAAGTQPASKQLAAQRKVRHWYWASVFTNRYSGSVESKAAQDFLAVGRWFDDDDNAPPVIQEFSDQLQSLELHRETKRGSATYNAVFNLLVLQEARDWMTGNLPQYGDLDDHHIVPKRWGRDHGLGTKIDSILNRTPLTANTNRHVISDRLPNEYIPELIAENGEQHVRSILESHFISGDTLEILLRDPFGPDDFEAFLDARQRAIKTAIVDLLIKERLDLSPTLRDLDTQVEELELRLRRLIAFRLDDDRSRIPEHVDQKMRERITLEIRRNPAVDHETLASLSTALQFADFRELQDIVVAKSCWPLFEDVFTTKPSVENRFGAVANLRNGIRHSRTVNEVTKRDGEAALLWFDQVLPDEPATG